MNMKEIKGALKLFLIGGIIGVFAGWFIAVGDKNLIILANKISELLTSNLLLITLVFSVICILIIVLTFSRGKKEFLAKDNRGEYYDHDSKYQIVCSITGIILSYGSFIFYGWSLPQLINVEEDILGFIIITILFLINITVSSTYQVKTVKLVQKRETHLETKNEVMSVKFSNEYFKKLDEAQQMNVYEASYKNYKFTTVLIIAAIVISFLLNLVFMNQNYTLLVLGLVLIISQIKFIMSTYQKKEG